MNGLRRAVITTRHKVVKHNPSISTTTRFFSEKREKGTQDDDTQPTNGSTTPSPSSKPFDLFGFIKTEVNNINEVLAKSASTTHRSKRRLLQPDAKPTPQQGFVAPEYTFDEKGQIIGVKYASPSKDDVYESGKEFSEDKSEEQSEDQAPEKPESQETAVMIVQGEQTVWSQRMDNLKDKIRSSSLLRPFVRLNSTLETSENKYVQALNDARYDVLDKVEELREKYETDQTGSMARIRRAADTFSSPAQYAYERLLEEVPGFNLEYFEEDMVQYVVPLSVKGLLGGDVDLIASMFGDPAREAVLAIVAQQKMQQKFPDTTILDIKAFSFDIDNITISNEVLQLKFTCVVDMIDCTRNAKGEIIEGSKHRVMPYFFVFSVIPEKYNPDSDWRVVEIMYQKMMGIE